MENVLYYKIKYSILANYSRKKSYKTKSNGKISLSEKMEFELLNKKWKKTIN